MRCSFQHSSLSALASLEFFTPSSSCSSCTLIWLSAFRSILASAQL